LIIIFPFADCQLRDPFRGGKITIEHFSEAVTGEAAPATLEGLSSSIPTISLMASLSVIGTIGTIVVKFLDAWEKIKKIRHVKEQLTDLGMKGKAVEELTDQITTTVNEVVEESIQITLTSYKGDMARKNELESALRKDTRRLFGQIERGLTIQFRAEPKKDADEIDKKALEAVVRISRQIQFPQIDSEPVLLEAGEVLEDNLIETVGVTRRINKSTTTTTSTKKDPSK
jgi:hypothetical protein